MTDKIGAPSCPQCGSPYRVGHRFCGGCGATLPAAPGDPAEVVSRTVVPPPPPPSAANPSPARQPIPGDIDRLAGPRYPTEEQTARPPAPAQAGDGSLAWYISPNRILLLTFLTTGLYIFYWMYITWRHYRDHSNAVAYPVWHALTLLVPVYQLFRLHAHMRVYQEMMEQRGVPTTLSPMLSVGLFLVAVALVWVAARLIADPELTTLTQTQQIGYFVANVARVAILAAIIWRAQGNLNRYWQHRVGMRLASAPYTLVELVLVVLGIFNWIGWVIIMMYPELLLNADASE